MRILSRLPERHRTAPIASGPLARKRFEPTRSGAPAREPREISEGLAPVRGIALALGIGALAWLAILLAITL